MNTALLALFISIGVGIAVWLFSFLLEALRPVPLAPRSRVVVNSIVSFAT